MLRKECQRFMSNRIVIAVAINLNLLTYTVDRS